MEGGVVCGALSAFFVCPLWDLVLHVQDFPGQIICEANKVHNNVNEVNMAIK